MAKIIEGFKNFIFRGNAIDLAVGVVIGAAFNSVVSSLVKDLLTPLIAAIFGSPNFSNLAFTINKSRFLYGDFVNSLISFVLVAFAVYFFVMVPMNTFSVKFKKPKGPGTKQCSECLSEIPVAAKRCAFCGQNTK